VLDVYLGIDGHPDAYGKWRISNLDRFVITTTDFTWWPEPGCPIVFQGGKVAVPENMRAKLELARQPAFMSPNFTELQRFVLTHLKDDSGTKALWYNQHALEIPGHYAIREAWFREHPLRKKAAPVTIEAVRKKVDWEHGDW
jgi:hypothetical protein